MDEQWRRGYPIDRRSLAQRQQDERDPLGGDFEFTAGRVLARCTGERVYLQDDGSAPRMPDLRIEYADGRRAFGEAWKQVDRNHAETVSVLRRTPELAAPWLNRVWTVRIGAGFRAKRRGAPLEQWLPDLLAEFEAAGQFYEYVPHGENLHLHPGPAAGRAGRWGIRGLASRPTESGEAGHIRFVCWEVGGPAEMDWQAFHAGLDEEINAATGHMRGNREKLREAGGDESHAVLGVTWCSPWMVIRALSCRVDELPPQPPPLPPEFTHLWLVAIDVGQRALAWDPALGWFDVSTRWATE